MTPEIDVSGYDLTETLAKHRRRCGEAEIAEGMSELDALLLPVSLAVARLAARIQVAEAAP